jgi:uncharacterized protein (TIGR03435 family)
MRLMVQSLLEERFKLMMHRETKDTPVYLLAIAKGGHKLQPAKDEKGNPIVSLPPPEQDQEKMAEWKRNALSNSKPFAAIATMPKLVSDCFRPPTHLRVSVKNFQIIGACQLWGAWPLSNSQ